MNKALLVKVDLRNAEVTPKQLSQVWSLSRATLPDGTQCAKARAHHLYDRNEQEHIKNGCLEQFKNSWSNGWRPPGWTEEGDTED